MLLSLNELKRLTKITISDTELLDLIGSRLVEIESVTDWSERYKKIYIVRVLSAEQIEGTHLHLCKIDAGKELNNALDPDSNNSIQVVCGAPNVKKDMFAVWIAPGAIIPASFSDSEPFKISTRKLRGFMSFGMLAGLDELALGDDHSGIVELDPHSGFKPGDSFAEKFDLNDKIIEVENKSLTHRPDCFGLIGFARELAGILDQDFSEPTLPTIKLPKHPSNVKIESPDLCPAYTYSVITLKDPLATSPYLTPDAVFLAKAGMHSISKIVDITNIYMLKTGQPLHAFDYDAFLAVGTTAEPAISVRLARAGEHLTLLDDTNLALTPDDILITSNDIPVALAGAMGGASTKITASTRRVLLESATFSLYHLRKTQMAHGIFSEAITRFTKGQPAVNCEPVLLAASSDLVSASSGAHADFFSTAYPLPLPNLTITLTTSDINSLLGSAYSTALIKSTLNHTGFKVTVTPTPDSNDTLTVSVPAWRTDIHIKEDIIEEVGRLLGYDNLPLTFPTRPFTASLPDQMLALKQRLRTTLADRLGFNEILTYSFVSEKLLTRAGLSPDDTYKITNSISPDLECFRPALLPSLLSKLPENLKAGFRNFSLFELNQVSAPSLGLTTDSVPICLTHLAFTTFGDFYQAKSALLALAHTLRLPLSLRPCPSSTTFESKRSADLYLSETKLGTLGELSASVLKNFKLSSFAPISACEFTLNPLLTSDSAQTTTECISYTDKTPATFNPATETSPFYHTKFQPSSRDLTIRSKVSVSYSVLEHAILDTLNKEPHLLFTLEPLSIYSKLHPFRHTTFRLTLANTEKTFTSSELSDIIKKITESLSALGAEVV